MKKVLFSLSFIMMFLIAISNVNAESIYINNHKINSNGYRVINENGTIFVPLRLIQDKLAMKTSYNEKNQTISGIKTSGKTAVKIVYFLNGNYVYKHEKTSQGNLLCYLEPLGTSIKTVNKQTMIPVKVITQTLGYKAAYNYRTKHLFITTTKNLNMTVSSKDYMVDGDISKLNKMEIDVFMLTNYERLENNRNPLILDIKNSVIARIKSRDMHDKNYFDHTSPTYGSPFDMMKKFNIDFIYAGENLAAGFGSAQSTVDGWMNSPGHRENLLRTEFQRVGIGYYSGPNGYKRYYTQWFTSK